MSFIDKVKVEIVAGKGGDGRVSFRTEKFIDKGGPNGGDGGNGGDVVLFASRNQNTLAAFRYQKRLQAESGNPGGENNKHGRSGKDLIVAVPVGTVATDQNGRVLADLIEDGQKTIIADGGRGGFGNAHFVSSRRQAPKFAEKGDAGDELELTFELKMIADVGLIGLPNAGKSTLLSVVSNARPEIANYPFTTLTPNLGVVDIDKGTSVLMADIPGLIEGASEGKGLGHDFLRHVERTAVILHLIDAYNDDVASVYTTIRGELKAYQAELATRPEIIALTKVEGLDEEIINDLIAQLKKVAKKTPIFAISSASGQGMKPLLYAIKDMVVEARKKPEAAMDENAIPVLTLSDNDDSWKIEKGEEDFTVRGKKIELFARRTDFDNEEAVQRLRDIMRKMGILHELVRQGIEADQLIRFGDSAGEMPY